MTGGGFWQWLEARSDRRAAHKLLLIERGLDARSLAVRTLLALDAKFIIAVGIIGLFAWAFAKTIDLDDRDARNLMIGAIIAAFAGAWGYYLGSSNTSNRANERADKAIEMGAEALKLAPKPPEADVKLKPGETATIGAAAEPELGSEGDPPLPPPSGPSLKS